MQSFKQQRSTDKNRLLTEYSQVYYEGQERVGYMNKNKDKKGISNRKFKFAKEYKNNILIAQLMSSFDRFKDEYTTLILDNYTHISEPEIVTNLRN